MDLYMSAILMIERLSNIENSLKNGLRLNEPIYNIIYILYQNHKKMSHES